MYLVAAVLESLSQSNGMTSQRISDNPSCAAAACTASLDSPPGVRYSFGMCPVAAVMASLALDSWLGMSSGGMVVRFGCSQVWLPTSMPASAMRLAPSGLAATLLPIKKNVALALLSLRMLSSRSVYGLGPSSNVRATNLDV